MAKRERMRPLIAEMKAVPIPRILRPLPVAELLANTCCSLLYTTEARAGSKCIAAEKGDHG